MRNNAAYRENASPLNTHMALCVDVYLLNQSKPASRVHRAPMVKPVGGVPCEYRAEIDHAFHGFARAASRLCPSVCARLCTRERISRWWKMGAFRMGASTTALYNTYYPRRKEKNEYLILETDLVLNFLNLHINMLLIYSVWFRRFVQCHPNGQIWNNSAELMSR